MKTFKYFDNIKNNKFLLKSKLYKLEKINNN